MITENMKCPNCAGQLLLDNKKKIKRCPYCDAEFGLDNTAGVQEKDMAEKETLSSRLFDFKNKAEPNKEAMISFKEACMLINGNNTVEDYLKGLENIARTNDAFAMADINNDLMQKVVLRVHSLLRKNENILVYKDSGIISKAKSGLMITDENIYFLEKKGIVSLALKDIYSISFGLMGSNWYLNNEDTSMRYSLDSIGCSSECTGMIIALICTMARDKNSEGYKIIFTN